MRTLHTYTAAALMTLAAALAAACSTDDTTETEPHSAGGKATVSVRLSAGGLATRADSWTAGTGKENINTWLVVVANASGTVVGTLASSAEHGGAAQVANAGELALDPGTYTFYAFANTTLTAPTVGTAVSYDTQTYTSNAIGYSADGNDYIPMSNRQTIAVSSDAADVTLYLVRMYAKVELQLSNATYEAVAVSGVSLGNITPNGDNIMLLPQTSATTAQTAQDGTNISATATTAEHTFEFTGLTVPANSTDATTATFYLNESKAAGSPQYFILTLTTGTGALRYAMLDWSFIARNDRRIIPITIDDYRLSFDVEQYSPIGVYPEVSYTDGTLNISSNYYGELHIEPIVTKVSTGETVAYSEAGGTDTDYWAISEPDATNSPGDYFPIWERGEGSIYDIAPAWNASAQAFEGMLSTTSGYAIHQMNIALPSGNTMAVKVQVNLSY